jgi:hypothetical protein
VLAAAMKYLADLPVEKLAFRRERTAFWKRAQRENQLSNRLYQQMAPSPSCSASHSQVSPMSRSADGRMMI